ncbi:DUF4388 domain-containing protein, partial [bacterium]|nr:DUF4388 domain-containing protein [bacterium]
MDTQQQPLQGRLEDVHFSEILLTISQRKETGVLHVVRYRIEKDIYFQDGRIVFAKSNDRDERLGELVLRSGKIGYRHLDESSKKVVPGLRLGTILVQEGFLKASDLYLGVIQQVEEIVYSIFDWSEGTFAFRNGELPTKEVITLSISTPDIILKGISRVWRWSWVRDWIGPLNTVYVRKDDWETVAKRMSITPQIQAMIDLLEQPRLLEEILDISAMSNFETCKLLWALLIIGLIQPAMAQISTLQMPFEPEITSDIFMTDHDAEKPAPWPHDDTPALAKQQEVEIPAEEPVIIPHEQFFIPVSTEEKVEPPLPYDPLSEETPIETPLQLPVLIPPKPAEVVTKSIDDTAEVISPETESQPVEVAKEEKIEEKVEVTQEEKIEEQVETTQEEPQEQERKLAVPTVAEIEGHEMLMASTLAAAPVEVSFSDLAEAAAPAMPVTPEPLPSIDHDRWEEVVATHVKNLNEVHRFLFEMLRMEMGPSISNFLARILNKVSAQHPLVFDGVKMNEYGELDGAALESNIQGNLADKYLEAFSFLLDEERRMMQSFLDRKRAEAIEGGMNRILEK